MKKEIKLKNYCIGELNNLCKEIRKDIVTILYLAKSGHTAGPLGAVEQYVALYFGGILRYDSSNPKWDLRDKVLISNGHYAPLLYTILAYAGYFDRAKLKTLRVFGSDLQGHPHRYDVDGIENSSGADGEGLSQAIGMAIACKMDKKDNQIYCLMGDGEQDEGNIWEAVMLAGKLKLENLTAIIDRNKIQSDGFTEDILPLKSLGDNYESFGWKVIEIDGHDIKKIIDALVLAKKTYEKPVLIICNTIPGKSISFMENRCDWHGWVPNQEELEAALKELN